MQSSHEYIPVTIDKSHIITIGFASISACKRFEVVTKYERSQKSKTGIRAAK